MKQLEADIQSVKRIMIAAVTVIGICFSASTVFFVFSYYQLAQSIESERSHYLTEVTGQIADKIDTIGQRYAADFFYIPNRLERTQPQTFTDLQRLYPPADAVKIMFAGPDGTMVLSDGTAVSGAVTLPETTNDHTVLIQFCPVAIPSGEKSRNFWVFATAITPRRISGTLVSFVIKAIPAERIQNLLTTTAFADMGSTCLIAEDGTIFAKSNESDIIPAATNFFNWLHSAGISARQLHVIKKTLSTDAQSAVMVKLHAEKWLLSFTRLSVTDDFIMVAVPLSRAATGTYLGIFQVILFAGIAFLFLALELMVLSVYFSVIEKKRTAHTAAITAQSNFLSKMSHDIRTPLSTILGMITLARQEVPVPPKIAEYLEKAGNSASYLLELVNDILDINRIENGKMKLSYTSFSLVSVLSDIAAMMQSAISEKKVTFTITQIESDSPRYLGDSIRIKQILMNLLSNAVKFTPSEGTITIDCSRKNTTAHTDLITFTITDSGIGMSPDFMNRIFRPFEQEQSSYTAPYTGSGLGLSIVRSLTEMMGGTVTVNSTLGKGSTFTVSIPLEQDRTQTTLPDTPALQNEPFQFNGQRILLAEDNMLNRQMAAELITTNLNIIVDAVADGKEAVEAFLAHQPQTYVAILLDIQMPVMNGLEAAQRIRAAARADARIIPIFALSANAFDEDIKLSLAAGMNAHLAKPIDLHILANELHRFVSKGEGHSKPQEK
jgi:signal transduction histidine kinase/CheY-like chemotaxis protein